MSETRQENAAGTSEPLSFPVFRALWIATIVSNVGTWMHDVGAGWLMTSLSPSPLLVALVQAATTLPMFLLALPAGAMADIVDRRKMLMAAQLLGLLAASLLAILTLLGLVTPEVLLAGTFGVVIGLISGYKGGRVDRLLMGWVDVQVSFPGLLLAMLLIALVGGTVWTVAIILAINGWMVYARMTRGVVLSVRERPFVEAAEMLGSSPFRVVSKHVLPNLVTPLATLAVLEFARIILAEAALSFLGLGIQYPGVTWGLDISRAGDHELFGNQWLIIYPGLLLSLTVLAVNLLSSWLRVMLDPQEREKRFAASVQNKGGM